MVEIAAAAIAAAQAAHARWGAPASISLAQYGVESAWGAKVTGTFNYFGIKALPGQPFTLCPTHEYIAGRFVPMMQPFADYASPAAAFDAHAQLLATHPAYHAFRAAAAAGDVKAACEALTGVYATAPGYGDTLWSLIQADGLTRYDVGSNP